MCKFVTFAKCQLDVSFSRFYLLGSWFSTQVFRVRKPWVARVNIGERTTSLVWSLVLARATIRFYLHPFLCQILDVAASVINDSYLAHDWCRAQVMNSVQVEGRVRAELKPQRTHCYFECLLQVTSLQETDQVVSQNPWEQTHRKDDSLLRAALIIKQNVIRLGREILLQFHMKCTRNTFNFPQVSMSGAVENCSELLKIKDLSNLLFTLAFNLCCSLNTWLTNIAISFGRNYYLQTQMPATKKVFHFTFMKTTICERFQKHITFAPHGKKRFSLVREIESSAKYGHWLFLFFPRLMETWWQSLPAWPHPPWEAVRPHGTSCLGSAPLESP